MSNRQSFQVGSYTRPTTAAPVKIATGTATARTLMQLVALTTCGFQILEFSIEFDGALADIPISVELFTTTVAATGLTALAATDVARKTFPQATDTIPLQYGTALSGFNTAGAATEGTVANYIAIDHAHAVPPSGGWVKEWALGSEPVVPPSGVLRVRVTNPGAASVNALVNLTIGFP